MRNPASSFSMEKMTEPKFSFDFAKCLFHYWCIRVILYTSSEPILLQEKAESAIQTFKMLFITLDLPNNPYGYVKTNCRYNFIGFFVLNGLDLNGYQIANCIYCSNLILCPKVKIAISSKSDSL